MLKFLANNDDTCRMNTNNTVNLTNITNDAISQAADAILTSHDARHGDYWLDVYDRHPFTDSLLEGLLSSPVGVTGNRPTKPA